MKKILALLSGLILITNSYADCSSSGLWVFPSEGNIKQNSIFVLEGYAASQDVILGLNKKYPVYLKSGTKRINLLVSGTFIGQLDLTQAVLKPEIPLEAGLTYTLCIGNLHEVESLERYISSTEGTKPYTYKVEAGQDLEKPVFVSAPKEFKKKLIHYGCGPEIYVIFNLPVKDKSDAIVKTRVKSLQTGQETTYYVALEKDNKLQIGHGMCGGAFTFDKGKEYEVRFTVMDMCGNVTEWTGEPIKFTKPTIATE